MRPILFPLLSTLIVVGCSTDDDKGDAWKLPPADEPSQVLAKPVDETEISMMICKRGGDSRALEIVKKDAGCALKYLKFGEVNDVAISAHGIARCQGSQMKIEGRLRKAGFQCN